MEIKESFESLCGFNIWEFETCYLNKGQQEVFEVHVCLTSVDRTEDEVKTLLRLSFCKVRCTSTRKLVLVRPRYSSVIHQFVEFLRFDGVNVHSVFLKSIMIKYRS